MRTQKIYLASSWRNEYQQDFVKMLREQGYEVYDYKNPRSGGPVVEQTPELGFSWKSVDPLWGNLTIDLLRRYREMLRHEVAQQGFAADFNAMKWADTCLLLLPSGRSAHLEAGWMAGAGKKLVVHMPPVVEICLKCRGGWLTADDLMGMIRCDCDHGLSLRWAFEPELMYLIGGEPDLITLDQQELLRRLEE